MAIGKVKKQGWEKFYISGSILKWQEDDSTETVVLATSTVIAEDKDGVDVSATLLAQASKSLDDDLDGDFSDNMLAMQVQAGSEVLSPYKVTFKMITSEDNQFEVDIRVEIKEV